MTYYQAARGRRVDRPYLHKEVEGRGGGCGKSQAGCLAGGAAAGGALGTLGCFFSRRELHGLEDGQDDMASSWYPNSYRVVCM